MIKYVVEYTASVTGSMAGRDDGQPYRTTKTGTDRITMLQIFKKCVGEGGKRYGREKPYFFESVMTEVPTLDCLDELEEFESTKNDGGGI